MPECLVPRCATTALEFRRIGAAGEHCRDPIAVFDDGNRRFCYCGIRFEYVSGLGPEPLRRIDSADVFDVIDPAPGSRKTVNSLGLSYGSVVLPKHKHCVRVLGELRVQGQGTSGAIREHRSRTSRIDCNAPYGRSDLGSRLIERFPNGGFQTLHVIERVLTEPILDGATIETFGPSGIILNGTAQYFSVGCFNNNTSY